MNIKDLIKVELSKNQLQALSDLADDIGVVLFQNSTILKKINQNDFDVADEFLRWTVRNGRRDSNMLASRQQEIKLFTK
jgi:lysozyme